MTTKQQSQESPSLAKLRELVLDQLKHVGVQEGQRKPGDGRYSAILRKPGQ